MVSWCVAEVSITTVVVDFLFFRLFLLLMLFRSVEPRRVAVSLEYILLFLCVRVVGIGGDGEVGKEWERKKEKKKEGMMKAETVQQRERRKRKTRKTGKKSVTEKGERVCVQERVSKLVVCLFFHPWHREME